MADELMKKTSTAMERPAFLPADAAPEGTEHITSEDVAMPRLALAQNTSPQLQEGKPEYIANLKQGQLFNSLTGDVYGKGPIEFVIVRADPPRWMELAPYESGGGIIDRNVPIGDPRTQWGMDGSKPKATMFYDYIVMMLPSRELIALSFKSTGITTARRLNGLIKMRQRPIYEQRYAISTASKTKGNNTFWIYQIANAGWVPDQDTYNLARQYFNALKSQQVEIHREGDAPDVDDTSATEFPSVDEEAPTF